MKNYTLFRYTFATLLFGLLFSANAFAQLTLGLGFAGMKYYGDANERPLAVGFNGNIGIELSAKSRLVLDPTIFIPVTYSYNQQVNVNGVPSVDTTSEQLKTVEAALLYQYDLLGNNKGGAVIYIAAGPAVMIYNANVTRQNASSLNYAGGFRDYMLDARAGVEIPFLMFLKLFGEVEIEPKIASDFKADSNNISYTPNAGSLIAATIGLRVHL